MENLCGVVLAGGASSRMQLDKANLQIGGQTLLERAVRLLLSVCGKCAVAGRDRPDGWPEDLHDVRFIPDRPPVTPVSSPAIAIADPARIAGEDTGDTGPIIGVFTALMELQSPILVLAVDMPAVPQSLLESIAQRHRRNPTAPAVLTRWTDENGQPQIEPLVAVYTPVVLPMLEERIKSGKRSLWALAENPRTIYWNVPAAEAPSLVNLNDPAAWQKYLEEHP